MGLFDKVNARWGLDRRFGFILPKTKEEKKPLESLPSVQTDGSIVIETTGAGAMTHTVNFDAIAGSTEYEAIKRYQRSAINSEIDRAIREIVSEAISISEVDKSVNINFKANTEFGKNIQKKVIECFDEIYDLLNFDVNGIELFRKWYIDSKLIFFKVVDPQKPKEGIKELAALDPLTCRKVVVIERNLDVETGVFVTKQLDEYFVYNEDSLSPFPNTGQKISADSICYVPSGLYDYGNKRPIGYLHKAIRHLNQLRMIEDSIIIYRLSRAPERRVFYVDVGNLPKQRAEQYMRDIMNRYRNKQQYDSQTGEMRDGYNHVSILEDFWMPRREGGKSTEISTLPAGQNLGDLADLDYFKKKLWEALDVPVSRMQSDTRYTFGRSSEINRDEVNFTKHIEQLRRLFSELFYDLLKTQLLLKNIITKDEWDTLRKDTNIVFLKDAYFTELKEQEVLKSRVETVQQIESMQGKYFSSKYIRRKILRQSDEEIEQIDKEIEDDKKNGIGVDPAMGGMDPSMGVDPSLGADPSLDGGGDLSPDEGGSDDIDLPPSSEDTEESSSDEETNQL